MVRRTVCLLLLALGFVSVGSAVVVADDGPPRVASTAGPVRPRETVLRLGGSGNRELVIFVGGLASDPRDTSPFAVLAARLPERSLAYFGADRDGIYETRGSIAANGTRLRDAVRRKVRRDDYERVHIVAHSMGGNVGDAAFGAGLGWRDSVDSYTALDSPHRGSRIALALREVLDDPFVPRTEARELLQFFGAAAVGARITGDEAALSDLARQKNPSAPERVRTVIVSVPDSEFVNGSESRLRGAERWVLPVMPLRRDGDDWKLGAHGLVLEDPVAREIVSANIDGHRAAPGIGVQLLGEAVGFVHDVVRRSAIERAEILFRQATWSLFAIKAMSGSARWPPR